MALDNIRRNDAYGIEQALQRVFPAPIISRRNPTANDKAPIGQMWVNRTANTTYILSNIAGNAAVWGIGATTAVGNFAAGGSVTAGTGVIATTSITAGTTITAGTGLVATTGGVTVAADGADISGTVDINTTTANVTSINRGGTGAVNIGNSAADTDIEGTNVYVTLGDAAGADYFTVYSSTPAVMAAIDSLGNAQFTGNVTLDTAAAQFILPGPVSIMSGAGAPAVGLAVNAGDMYIRTNPAGAASRIYIATAANTWTNVTCAA